MLNSFHLNGQTIGLNTLDSVDETGLHTKIIVSFEISTEAD